MGLKPHVQINLSYLCMHQSFPVVNYPPCCHSNSHNLVVHGVTQGVVSDSLPYMLHHTSMCPTSDDPRTCAQHNILHRVCDHGHVNYMGDIVRFHKYAGCGLNLKDVVFFVIRNVTATQSTRYCQSEY